MLVEADVIALTRSIVATELPEELPSFDFEGPTLVRELMLGSSTSRSNADVTREADQFAGVSEMLQFAKLVAGTVVALGQMLKLIKESVTPEPHRDQLIELWKAKLIIAGVPAQRAGRIASRFYGDALTVMGKKP